MTDSAPQSRLPRTGTLVFLIGVAALIVWGDLTGNNSFRNHSHCMDSRYSAH